MPTHSLLPQSAIRETLDSLYGTEVPFLETPFLHVGRDFAGRQPLTVVEPYPRLNYALGDAVQVDLPRRDVFTGAPFVSRDGTYDDMKMKTDSDVDADLGNLITPMPPPSFYELSTADRERNLQQNIQDYFEERASDRAAVLEDALLKAGMTAPEVDAVLREERVNYIMGRARAGLPVAAPPPSVFGTPVSGTEPDIDMEGPAFETKQETPMKPDYESMRFKREMSSGTPTRVEPVSGFTTPVFTTPVGSPAFGSSPPPLERIPPLRMPVPNLNTKAGRRAYREAQIRERRAAYPRGEATSSWGGTSMEPARVLFSRR